MKMFMANSVVGKKRLYYRTMNYLGKQILEILLTVEYQFNFQDISFNSLPQGSEIQCLIFLTRLEILYN